MSNKIVKSNQTRQSADNDKVMTPPHIAEMIVDLFPIKGKVLDPFRGDGAFYNALPDTLDKEWCEIDDGRDFFDYHKKVDWIVSNPPYSIFSEVMRHSYEIADNILYLIPLNKIVSSMGRIREMDKYGGIVSLFIIPANECGFPFGFPACAVWIKSGYHDKIEWRIKK